MRVSVITMFCATLAATMPVYARVSVRIESGVRSEMEAFAVGKLEQSLKAAGYSVTKRGGQSVDVRLREARGAPQSYSIRNSGGVITVAGGDDRGLLYGTLRLAEQVKLGTPLEAVRDELSRPYVALRAFKFNLPLPGTLYLSPSNLKNNQWFWSFDYWTKFLDELAEDRFDVLELWSAEPWGQMVSLTRYPEATPLSPAVMRQHIQFFHQLFHLAKVRGIDIYLVTWNINLAPAFARVHNLPEQNVDSPLVRDYLRDCIRTLLVTYPDVTGLGTTQGEQMDVIPENKRGDWIADVYFRAIRESGRKSVPFILRYWGGTPEDTEKAAAEYLSGPVYLDIKYNGEDVYSSPMYHVENSAWLTQKHNYRFLWHLRNDALFSFRWGNPQFVSALMRYMKQTHPAGFTYGSEEDIPGPESFDTASALAHRPWRYEFQKQWFMFALWGRLGYNRDLSSQLWRKYFRYEYGSAADALYDCTVAAGRIAPLITSFHWNYMNGDWMPEGSIGSWNTSYEQPRVNYRRFEMYHNILDYIFNNTIDGTYENIPQYAARVLGGASQPRSAASPLDVANKLEQDGDEALQAARIPAPGAAYRDRFQAAQSDDEAYGRLALYYAEKLRGATDLCLYISSGKPEEQVAAVTHLKNALAEWRELVAITQKHYLPRVIWQMGTFHWSMYTGAVEHDVVIAQSAKPARQETETWQVAAASGQAAWKTFKLREQRPFGMTGLFQWRLYSNALLNTEKVEQAVGRNASYLWKRDLLPSGSHEWVLAIPGNRPARVMLNGGNLASASALDSHGYTIFQLGSKGVVQAELPAGTVPQVTAVARAGKPIILPIAAAQVIAPLTISTDGALELAPGGASALEVASGVLGEVNPAGSALFRMPIAAPGFYRVRCELLGGTEAQFAMDRYNGGDHSRLEVEGASEMTRQKWVPASEDWAIPLGPGEHTLRIYLWQSGEQIRNVELVPAAE